MRVAWQSMVSLIGVTWWVDTWAMLCNRRTDEYGRLYRRVELPDCEWVIWYGESLYPQADFSWPTIQHFSLGSVTVQTSQIISVFLSPLVHIQELHEDDSKFFWQMSHLRYHLSSVPVLVNPILASDAFSPPSWTPLPRQYFMTSIHPSHISAKNILRCLCRSVLYRRYNQIVYERQ